MEKVIQPYGFTTKLELEDVRFREVREEPFDIYGLYDARSEGVFRRLPEDVAKATSPAVAGLSVHTAGGRIRFCTDSEYVAIHAVMPVMGAMSHFAFTGSAGFDLYIWEGSRYYFFNSFRPGIDPSAKMMENIVHLPGRKLRQIMIHFPLYSSVEKLYIGLQEDAIVDHGLRYRFDKPVVYYGSSITQGGCASRPGTSYQSIISIDRDCDFINLGFSGSARAEPAIRQYIASLDMSVFVLDYDHNAPTMEHLRDTHETFYREVRAAHPDLPIVFVTAPETQWYLQMDAERAQRHVIGREIIFETYMKAFHEGDLNVRFIDGDTLFEGNHHDICTVDGCHPTDAGFLRMADKIGHVVGSLLR
ncbi:MAG: hypothetical protein E7662_06280 [Ruminococcaceae bacterium]|nr:hypothetical protein [Oscillospiraceae bacterium]